MRDTYVLILFAMFIFSGTFLAWTGKVEPQLILTPIVTGFLGLLASTQRATNGSNLAQLPGAYVPKWSDRIPFTSKPPPAEPEKEKDRT